MYTVDYFITKFEAIPSRKLVAGTTSDGKGAGCAIGWCAGVRPHVNACYNTLEYFSLVKLFADAGLKKRISGQSDGWLVADVNNGDNPNYQQRTPKRRILAALYDIKSQQALKEVETFLTTQPELCKSN